MLKILINLYIRYNVHILGISSIAWMLFNCMVDEGDLLVFSFLGVWNVFLGSYKAFRIIWHGLVKTVVGRAQSSVHL